MGYRHKLGLLSKEKHSVIQDMTLGELKTWFFKNTEPQDDEDWYMPCYEITEEFYEIGKYFDDTFLENYTTPVFTKKETHEYFNTDGDFYILTKNGFLVLIDFYRQKTFEWFSKLLEANKQRELDGDDNLDFYGIPTLEKAIEDKKREWGDEFYRPYNISEKTQEIISSWSYEYTTFEMVRYYKTIDWENNLVTITGW
jgi:hypothetical protein